MIFKIKYNFVILELIGQPYFDWKQNNSKNVWNKCLINCFRIDSLSSYLRDKTTHLSMQHCFHVVFYIIGTHTCILCILEKISPSELVSNGYISYHNKMRRPRPKFKVSFYLYFCCFWINVTQINFENIKRKIQRIISDSCFQLKSWFNVDARAPSIPLLNFPFKSYVDGGICSSVAYSIRLQIERSTVYISGGCPYKGGLSSQGPLPINM